MDYGEIGTGLISMNEELGALTWANEVDVAPETLYAEATGSGLSSWMESDEDRTGNQPLELDPSQAPDHG
jgi:hypothetical protein